MNKIQKIISWLTGFVLLLGFGLFSAKVYSQEISFQASAPGAVRAGEQFQLSYSLSEKVNDFTPPDFGDFRYLGGPSTGSSTSINMVNGKTTRISNYTFTYYLQAPATSGKYSLSPAKATYKRKQYISNDLEIDVVGSSANNASSQNNTQGSGDKGTARKTNGKDIFVKLEFDKRTAYVGEQITAWVKLYTQVDIAGIDQQFKGPEFIGFYKQDVEIQPLSRLEPEKVGDDIYHTGMLKKVILYPQKTGEIIINPFELIVEIQKQTRRARSTFDSFFGTPYERSRISLKSKPVKLKIKPLPGSQPADFSGAVGSFTMKAQTNLNEVNTNDAITFKVLISGRGNVKLLDNVITGFPAVFDVFDPIKKVVLNQSSEGKSGTVSFEYTAIPRHTGEFVVDPFKLVYFDINTKAYKTIKSSPFNIRVNRGEGDSTSIVSSNLSKEDIELLGSDIRYIEPTTQLKLMDDHIFGKLWFFLAYIGSLLILIVVLIIRREQIKRSANKAKYLNRKAGRTASRRLKKAQKLLKDQNKEAYYDELEKALWGYISDKLGIPISELSQDKAKDVLITKGLNEELVLEFLKIIDTCQFARYAPAGAADEMSELFQTVNNIFNKIDQSL